MNKEKFSLRPTHSAFDKKTPLFSGGVFFFWLGFLGAFAGAFFGACALRTAGAFFTPLASAVADAGVRIFCHRVTLNELYRRPMSAPSRRRLSEWFRVGE
jgi:hypothetical protein